MKIVFTIGALDLGGAERVVTILSRELLNRDDEVYLLLYHDKPFFYKPDDRLKIIVEEKHIKKNNVLSHILFRRKELKKIKPDIVISFLAPYNIITLLSIIGTGIKVIVADRSDPRFCPKNFLVRKIRNFLYLFADRIVVQSDLNLQYFSKKIRKKASIIYNPISVGKYFGKALETIKEDKIITVGRIIKTKNNLMLIDAFDQIKDLFPSYKLVLYGDGDMFDELENTIKLRNLKSRVEINHAKNNIFDYMLDSKLFVLTSNFEGQPNALFEAMLLGIPVISTRVSGASEIIEHGVNGLLVDCKDVASLSNAIKKVLGDAAYQHYLAKNALSLKNNFDEKKITDKWISLISQI